MARKILNSWKFLGTSALFSGGRGPKYLYLLVKASYCLEIWVFKAYGIEDSLKQKDILKIGIRSEKDF